MLLIVPNGYHHFTLMSNSLPSFFYTSLVKNLQSKTNSTHTYPFLIVPNGFCHFTRMSNLLLPLFFGQKPTIYHKRNLYHFLIIIKKALRHRISDQGQSHFQSLSVCPSSLRPSSLSAWPENMHPQKRSFISILSSSRERKRKRDRTTARALLCFSLIKDAQLHILSRLRIEVSRRDTPEMCKRQISGSIPAHTCECVVIDALTVMVVTLRARFSI